MSPFTRKRRTSGGRRSGQCGDAGFTLLEVLIAFAILAVMLVPILQVFGAGLGISGTARGYAEGALLARSRLAEMTADKLKEGDSSGSFDERGYRWQASVTIDSSDVTLPDNSLVGMPERRPGQSQRRSPGASSTSERRSGFGNGSSTSGFGQRRSLFGQSRSAFGEASRPASGPSRPESSFGSSRAGSSAPPGTGGGEEEEANEAQFIPYRVAVTVEWGDANSGGGAVTLTTVRLVQPNAEPEPEPDAR